MYSDGDLSREIADAFRLMLEDADEVPKSWLVSAVLEAHPGIAGPDTEFAKFCMTAMVSTRVDKFIREIRAREDQDGGSRQTAMPGFKRLQDVYVLTEEMEVVEGATVRVVAEQKIKRLRVMTVAEVLAKADEHHAQGLGHFEHEDELRRWADRLMRGGE